MEFKLGKKTVLIISTILILRLIWDKAVVIMQTNEFSSMEYLNYNIISNILFVLILMLVKK